MVLLNKLKKRDKLIHPYRKYCRNLHLDTVHFPGQVPQLCSKTGEP